MIGREFSSHHLTEKALRQAEKSVIKKREHAARLVVIPKNIESIKALLLSNPRCKTIVYPEKTTMISFNAGQIDMTYDQGANRVDIWRTERQELSPKTIGSSMSYFLNSDSVVFLGDEAMHPEMLRWEISSGMRSPNVPNPHQTDRNGKLVDFSPPYVAFIASMVEDALTILQETPDHSVEVGVN